MQPHYTRETRWTHNIARYKSRTMRAEALKGNLDGLIMAEVGDEPVPGHAIIQELKRRSGGTFRGSLRGAPRVPTPARRPAPGGDARVLRAADGNRPLPPYG